MSEFCLLQSLSKKERRGPVCKEQQVQRVKVGKERGAGGGWTEGLEGEGKRVVRAGQQ